MLLQWLLWFCAMLANWIHFMPFHQLASNPDDVLFGVSNMYILNVGALNTVSKLYYKGVKSCSKMIYGVNKIKFISIS